MTFEVTLVDGTTFTCEDYSAPVFNEGAGHIQLLEPKFWKFEKCTMDDKVYPSIVVPVDVILLIKRLPAEGTKP
jgi:hypothetical protein